MKLWIMPILVFFIGSAVTYAIAKRSPASWGFNSLMGVIKWSLIVLIGLYLSVIAIVIRLVVAG